MQVHKPVLLQETIDFLSIQPNETVLEGTVGMGGHSAEIISRLRTGVFVGIDADSESLRYVEQHFSKQTTKPTTHFIEANFRDITDITQRIGIQSYDAVLLDLGWGSHQLENGRGLSFKVDEPLDMCYGRKEGSCAFNAYDVVNSFEEENLETIIRGFGEESWAGRIAKHIILAREKGPIATTKQLADIVVTAIPGKFRWRKLHPATKTFQAIRIAVNDELGAVSAFLADIPQLLSPGGRIAIITFHSLEDRIVKRTFLQWEKNGFGMRGTKKPIGPAASEIEDNYRSRSAKLRTFIVT